MALTFKNIRADGGSGGGAVDSVNGKTGVVVLTKSDIGLSQVNNTSDLSKPVSTAQATAIGVVQSDIDAHEANTSNPHSVTKTQVNLGNVDNTSDLNKPISNATQSALDSKQDKSASNYAVNPGAEVDLIGVNLYDDQGRTDPAFVVEQDLTFTAVAPGDAGNGIQIQYIFHATQSYTTPLVTVVSPTLITVAWYNGPTIANNPTATQLKAAWDAVSGAVALATCAITGTAGNRQYEIGAFALAGGGDASPVNGSGGVPANLTLTRDLSVPLVGIASFLLTKAAANAQGSGFSTDFEIQNADLGDQIQISMDYEGSPDLIVGVNADLKFFIYDITNSVLIPTNSVNYFSGASGTSHRYAVTFTASMTSTDYRVICHIATTNTLAWTFKFDSILISNVIDPTMVTEVASLVLPTQPITVAVTDHMAVMWQDGNTSWRPATMAGNSANSGTLFGFATNIIGLTADITIRGALSGFSFGPFVGYNQYVDSATAGNISPAPASFTDAYVTMGKGITSDTIMVEPISYNRLVTSKGGILTNGGLNNGTGDVVVAGGSTGQFLRYNTALANGFGPFTPVGTAPIVYTAATSAWSIPAATDAVAGHLTAADHTTYTGYGTTLALKAPLASPTFTGTPTLPTGTIAVTQTAGNNTTAVSTTAFVAAGLALKANLASPTFTGTPTLPTGTIAVTQTAGNSTTALATTAFVTTADNLKANAASPVFTGDINSSTGNLQISTIGKGVQIKTGANSRAGTSVLVGGTVTVSNTTVTANTIVMLTSQVDGGTIGSVRISAKVNGTSFTITSSNVLDTSTVGWYMIELIP